MAYPRVTNEGFQAVKGWGKARGPQRPEDEDTSPEYQEEVDALLARLTAGQDDSPSTINLDDEPLVGGSFKDAFLAGEPVGGGWDHLPPGEGIEFANFRVLDDADDLSPFQRNEAANIQAASSAAPSSDHQFLKNHLKANSPLSISEIRIPVGVGGAPDVHAALRINVFPFVEQTDYEHPYYEEAMLYQEEQARRAFRTPKPAMDLGGTEGVDFATRLRDSFLSR